MFRPTSDFIIIEKYEEASRIVRPDNVKADILDTFIVKDIGPGYIENGIRVEPDIQVGDRVIIVGKAIDLPREATNGSINRLFLARAGDVVAYERAEVKEDQFAKTL